jgi:hypothetical protein
MAPVRFALALVGAFVDEGQRRAIASLRTGDWRSTWREIFDVRIATIENWYWHL